MVYELLQNCLLGLALCSLWVRDHVGSADYNIWPTVLLQMDSRKVGLGASVVRNCSGTAKVGRFPGAAACSHQFNVIDN